MSGRIRDRDPPHEAMSSVDAQVVLVAEHRNGNLDAWLAPVRTRWSGFGSLEGPAGIPILLRQLLGLCRPFFRNASLLEGALLLIGVALAR